MSIIPINSTSLAGKKRSLSELQQYNYEFILNIAKCRFRNKIADTEDILLLHGHKLGKLKKFNEECFKQSRTPIEERRKLWSNFLASNEVPQNTNEKQKKKLIELQTVIVQLKDEIETREEENKTLEEDMKTLEEENQTLQEEKKTIEEELAATKTEVAEKDKQYNDLMIDYTSKCATVEKLQSEITALKEENQKRMAQLVQIHTLIKSS